MDTTSLPILDKALAASITASALPPIINAAKCAQLLGCSKEHIDTLADRGELPAAKFGRGWVFVTAQLLVHVAARCAQNAAQWDGRTRSNPADAEPTEVARAWQDADAKSPRTADRVVVQPPARRRGRPRLSVPA